MNVVSYYRYSTDNKAQVDNSEARQQDSVERIIYSRKWKHVGTYTDKAVSGTDDKPELLRLKQQLEDGEIKVDCICCDTLSRLSRRSIIDIHHDIGWIRDKKIKLSIASIKDGEPIDVDEVGKHLDKIIDVYQNNTYVTELSRNVLTGFRKLIKKNDLGWIGRAPYGYTLNNLKDKDIKTSLKTNGDLKVIKKIFKGFLAGKSINQLVPVMEQLKNYIDNPEKHANTTSIKNILRNSIYCGIRTFGVRGVGKHMSMNDNPKKYVAQNPLVQATHYWEYKAEGFNTCITVDQYKTVQEILDRNQKEFKKYPDRQKHLYSGLCRCSSCNTPMTASTWRRGKDRGKGLITYTCPHSTDKTRVCKEGDTPHRKSIRTDELDSMIEKQFSILLMSTDFHVSNIKNLADKMIAQSKVGVTAVEEDYSIQSGRLEELIELFMNTGNSTLKDSIDKQQKKLEELKQKVTDSLIVDDEIAFAKEQYENQNLNTDYIQYFGWAYESAVKIATLPATTTNYSRARFIRDEAGSLMVRTRFYLAKLRAGGNLRDTDISKIINPEPTKDTIKELANLSDQDITSQDVLNILLNMGLDHIKVSFELGLWRGRERRIPTELALVFRSHGGEDRKESVALGRNTRMGSSKQ